MPILNEYLTMTVMRQPMLLCGVLANQTTISDVVHMRMLRWMDGKMKRARVRN